MTITQTALGSAGYDGQSWDFPVTVADDEVASLVTSPSDALTVAEDAASPATYTVELAHAPKEAVTLTLTSDDTGAATVTPGSLTFTTANYSDVQTVTVTPQEDPDPADETVTITQAASGSAGYDGQSWDYTVTVTDDETATISVEDSGGTAVTALSVTEGDADGETVVVSLGVQPKARVTVAVATSDSEAAATARPRSLTFTPLNFATDQTVTVTAVSDQDALDDTSTVTLTADSGDTHGYAGISASVAVTVDDDETATIRFRETTAGSDITKLSVDEGATATYVVRLDRVPAANVTVTPSSPDTGALTVSTANTDSKLTFTPDAYAWQTVTVTGVGDSDPADEEVQVTHQGSGSAEYAALNPVLTVTVNDDEAGFTTSATSVDLTEGAGTVTYTVSLGTAPDSTVVVTPSSADTGAVTVATANTDNKLTFTTGNYSTAQNVTLTPVDDNDRVDESVAITHTGSGGGTGYDGVSFTVTAEVADDEEGVKFDVASLPLTEGGSEGTVDVSLGTAPTGDVTFTITTSEGGGASANSNTGAVTVTPSSLTFTTTNYSDVQTVTVTPSNDDDPADETVTLTFTGSGSGDPGYDGETFTLTVTVTDDETDAKVTVTPTTLDLDEDSETAAEKAKSYAVTLSSVPANTITVAVGIKDSDDAVSLSTTSLVFTVDDYDTAQNVTVTAVGDDDPADETVTVENTAPDGSGFAQSDVTVNVDDDETPTINVVDSDGTAVTALSVTEGDTDGETLSVSLGVKPKAAVTITPSISDTDVATVTPASRTFTRSDYDTARMFTITAKNDDDALNDTATVTLTATGSDGYAGEAPTVSVTVDDDETAVIKIREGAGSEDTTTLSVDEGTTTNYEVRLLPVPAADVTVTLTSDDTGAATLTTGNTDGKLTFTPSDFAWQTVTVAGITDTDPADEEVEVTHQGSGSAEYAALSPVLTVTVNDDDEGFTPSVTSIDLTEGGGTGVYTVSLGTAPESAVTVSLSSGDEGAVTVATANTDNKLTFTTGDYSTAQNVTLTPKDDDDRADETVTITHTGSGGGTGYDGVSFTVAANVTDDEEGLQFGTASLSLTEGGAAGEVTAKLVTAPTGDVTFAVTSGDTGAATVTPASLTFTTTEYSTVQTFTVTAVEDSDPANESVTVSFVGSGSGDAGYDDVTWSYPVTVTDDDSGSVTVTPATLDLDEDSDTATEKAKSYAVKLSAVPADTITVSVALSETNDAVTLSTSELIFTAADYNNAQNVTVTANTDTDAADETVTVENTAPDGTGFAQGDVTVNVDDDEAAPHFTISPGTLGLVEGGSDDQKKKEITLRIASTAANHPPTASVVVNVTSDDTSSVTVTPTSLTFTTLNYAALQTVTATAIDDSDAVGESVTITFAGASSNSAREYSGVTGTTSVSVTEANTADLVYGTASGSLELDEGGSDDEYTVALSLQPEGAVTLAIASGDTAAVTVSTAQVDDNLTFTADNYNTEQTVTVSSVEDDDRADESVTITHTATGAASYNSKTYQYTVKVDDDEDSGVTFTKGSDLPVTEGSGTVGHYTVALPYPPQADVTFSVTSQDTAAATVTTANAGNDLTFTTTNYDTAQSVTVTAVDDTDPGDETVTVRHTSSGTDAPGYKQDWDYEVGVNDDDSGTINVTSASLDLDEDSATESEKAKAYGVTLSVIPAGEVTVSVGIKDSDDAVTLSTTSLTFTTVNYATAQSVTVTAATDTDAADESVTVENTLPSSTGFSQGDVAVSVDDNEAAPHFTVSPGSVTVVEGGSDDQKKKEITLRIASSAANHPPTASVVVNATSGDETAVTVNPSSLTYTTGNYATLQTFTVTAVDDDDAVGESVTVTFTGASSNSAREYSGVTATATVSVTEANTADLVYGTASGDLELDEGGSSGTYTVELSLQPEGNVTLAMASGDTGAVTVSTARTDDNLTFTADNYNTAQTVTVSPVDDNDRADESVTITHTATGAASYNSKTYDYTVKVDDDEDSGVTFTKGSDLPVTEGSGTVGHYTVALPYPPQADVTFSVTSQDTAAVTVTTANAGNDLTFTTANYSVAQSVTVTAVDDTDPGDETVTVRHTSSVTGAPGYLGDWDYDVGVDDDDSGTINVTTSTLDLDEDSATESEKAKAYGVTLSVIPAGTVTVSVAVKNSDNAVTPSASELIFTTGNYSTAQSVTVTANTDTDAADESVTVENTLPESTGFSQADVAVSVDDDEAAPHFTVSATAVTVVEGGSDSEKKKEITLRIASSAENHPPTASVVVNATSGDTSSVTVSPSSQTYTTGNYATLQTFTVTAVDDDDAVSESVTVTFAGASSNSAREYNGVTATTTVSVTEADTAGLVYGTASGDLEVTEEGDAGTYTVKLSLEPTEAVTLSISSGDTGALTVSTAESDNNLTFTKAGYDTVQTVTVSPVDDSDRADESVTITHTASGDDSYDTQTYDYTVKVDDNEDDGVTFTAGTDLPVTEGSGTDGHYTVALPYPPQADVTFSVTSQDTDAATVTPSELTFTTANYSVAQSVTVTAVNDDDGADESVTVRHTSTATDAPGYKQDWDFAVGVTDDDESSLTLSTTTVSLTEATTDGGNEGDYTVKLSREPRETVEIVVTSADTDAVRVHDHPALTLTFTTTNYDTAQTVTVRSQQDNDAADESVKVKNDAPDNSGYADVEVTVSVDDNETAAVQVQGTAFRSLTEGHASDKTKNMPVRLSHVPTAAVTVSVSSGDSGAVSLTNADLTFSTTNWDMAQTVTLTAEDDNDAADESVTLTLAPSGASEYDNLTDPTETITVTDDETEGVTFANDDGTAALSISEADSDVEYTVVLNVVPKGNVTLAVASDDTGAATVSPTSLTFNTSNWDSEQTVSVSGVNDDDRANETVTVSHTASGTDAPAYNGDTFNYTVNVDDDEDDALTFDPETSLTVAEGDTDGTYTVKLAVAPQGDVTLAISSGDTDALTVSSSTDSLTFTVDNYDTVQTVTVVPKEDDDPADETVTVTHAASGASAPGYDGQSFDYTVKVTDNETASLTLSDTALSLEEDQTDPDNTIEYTVELSQLPKESVTVAVESDDSDAASVSTAALTFTTLNWDTAQTVTVTGVHDDDAADESVTISNTATAGSGYGSTDVTASVNDDEDATISVQLKNSWTQVREGGDANTKTRTMQVQLDAEPTADVTVTLTNPDTGAVTLDQSALTFTASSYGWQDVAVTAVDDDDGAGESVTISMSSSMTGGSGEYASKSATQVVGVIDDEAGDVELVLPDSLTIAEGAGRSYAVSLGVEPTEAVTVTLSAASDSGVTFVGPGALTFDTEDWSARQSVSIRAERDGDDDDKDVTLTHTLTGAREYAAITPAPTLTVSVTDSDTDGLQFQPADLVLSEAPVGDGDPVTYTVRLTTKPSADVTLGIASGDTDALTVAAATNSLTFSATNWDTYQTVTVTAVEDADSDNESVTLTHTATGSATEYTDASPWTYAVTVADDDTAALSVPAAFKVDEGGSGAYEIWLTQEPDSPVTVAITSSDSAVAWVDPTGVRITPRSWRVPRRIRVETSRGRRERGGRHGDADALAVGG